MEIIGKKFEIVGKYWRRSEKSGKDWRRNEKIGKDKKQAKHFSFFRICSIYFFILSDEKKGRIGGVGLRPHHGSLIRTTCSTGPILPCGAKGMEARRRLVPLKCYCTEEERKDIERQAETAGMSVSEYLRKAGMGTPIKNRVDQQAVKTLGKVNADLGRAGGLLKMLLKNDEKLIGYSGLQLKQLTSATIKEITELQASLALISQKILQD